MHPMSQNACALSSSSEEMDQESPECHAKKISLATVPTLLHQSVENVSTPSLFILNVFVVVSSKVYKE